ncbi:MAG: hypothetical protein IJL94_00280, partial [Erysipelotrichaceae bacterium]|nr:hypothetical protein [Erysipelotrichaceae bacterium]
MAEKKYMNIPEEKFRLANRTDRHDQKFETKAVGYFGDAWNRFKKNKSSVVAACVIAVLVVFSIVGPYCCNRNYQKAYADDNIIMRYQYLLPKIKFLEGTGIWDGTSVVDVSENRYYRLLAQQQETGNTVIVDVIEKYVKEDIFDGRQTFYKLRVNSYGS